MNGWSNWATWNAALWLQYDEMLYSLAMQHEAWAELLTELPGDTADGAKYADADPTEMQQMLDYMHS